MMSALEQEIIEKFRRLDKAAQKRLLQRLEADAPVETPALQPGQVTMDEWLAGAGEMRREINTVYGQRQWNSVELLREAQEERLNDLMGGS
jgi:hypothetical protein